MQLQAPWLKPVVWGVVVGAVATMIVGFSWMGWVLATTAERMAVERANAAVIVALTPACVASFMQQPHAATKLAEFRKIEPPADVAVTLTSHGGVIPLTLRNETGYAVRLRIVLLSPRLDFLEGATRDVVVSGEAHSLTFPVRAQTTGRFPVRVLVETPAGQRIAESQIRWFRPTIEEPHPASGATQPEFAPTTATGPQELQAARALTPARC